MELTLPPLSPYLPSLTWMQADEAGRAGMSPRDFSRTLVASNSPGGMVLSVPVVGGAPALKRLKPVQLQVSSHGDWPRVHLGAIEAAYGREPFFQHLFPGMAEIIIHYPASLAEMNARLLSALLEDVDFYRNIADIRGMREAHPARFADIRQRMMRGVDPSRSVVEAFFRFGPDVAFLL